MGTPLRSKLFAYLIYGLVGAFVLVLMVGAVRSMLGPPPPMPGDEAPAFIGKTPKGKAIRLADFSGKVVMLDFWLTSCVGCVGATPKLNRLQSNYKKRGFSILSLNQEPGEDEMVQRFMERRGITYPVLMDQGDIADRYGIHAFPAAMVIGRDGRIVAAFRKPVTETKMAKAIEVALAQTRRAPMAESR